MGEDRRELEAHLARLGPERLAVELVNLAEEDRDIERRVMLLIREEDPVALGAKLLFEGSAHFGTYVELLKLLPTGERAKAKQRAIGLALALGDVLSAASFLRRVGACADAERLTIERVAELETGDSDPLHAAWNGGVLRAARRRSSRAEG